MNSKIFINTLLFDRIYEYFDWIGRCDCMLWSIIVGGFIGFLAGAITNKGGAMGVIANVVAGLIGSSVGQSLFGTWGPSLAGMSLIPSVLGAVIVVAVVSFFFGKKG